MWLSAKKVSDSLLVNINLAVGVLTVISNSAALLITMAGNANHLANKKPEMVVFAMVGIVLVISSIVGLLKQKPKHGILKMQSLVFSLLCVLLALIGLQLRLIDIQLSQAIWSFGYLTIAAVYASYLMHRSYSEVRYRVMRVFVLFCFLPFCLIVDLTTFIRTQGIF